MGLTAQAQVQLDCTTTAKGVRAGRYSGGTPSPGTTIKNGTPCGVSTEDVAQVWNQGAAQVSGGTTGPGAIDVLPVAFWTGTENARFASGLASGSDLWSASDRQAVIDWNGPSEYSPPAPGPPSGAVGDGMANGWIIMSSTLGMVVTVYVTSSSDGTWDSRTGLCNGPTLGTSWQTTIAGTVGGGTNIPPIGTGWSATTALQALALVNLAPGKVDSNIEHPGGNAVVFAPDTFWVDSPTPVGEVVPPKVEDIVGMPNADGISVVYTLYLQVEPSNTLYFDFGDGTSTTLQDIRVCSPDCTVNHEYKQVDGTSTPVTTPPPYDETCGVVDDHTGVPATGATVVACQDVTVTAFVAWYDSNGDNYECISEHGGLGPTVPSSGGGGSRRLPGGLQLHILGGRRPGAHGRIADPPRLPDPAHPSRLRAGRCDRPSADQHLII